MRVYPNFSFYFIVGLRANQLLYHILGYKATLVVTSAEWDLPGGFEGLKSAATSQSVGNGGYDGAMACHSLTEMM